MPCLSCRPARAAVWIWLSAVWCCARVCPAAEFELHDGDEVVFVGNTFIERDQAYGYLETMLTARWPDRSITFRNLGWSGDTVWGEARAGFDRPEDGFRRLLQSVSEQRPTVIVLGYGLNESFAGEPGVPRFRQGLTALLEQFEKTDAAIVLLSPLPHAQSGLPYPDPESRNRDLRTYTDLIREIAEQRGHRFTDLFRRMESVMHAPGARRLSDNGIHLSEYGYWLLWFQAGREFGIKLGGPVKPIGKSDSVSLESSLPAKVENFSATPRGYRFDLTYPWLPNLQAPGVKVTAAGPAGRYLLVRGLPPGSYHVEIDGTIVEASDFQLQASVLVPLPLGHAPEAGQVEELRRAIIQKNRLYFHRWRPQNETYLFGFRKHEQGQNAAEVPKFDPLVEELEAHIAKLRVPAKHTYEIVKQGE